MYGVKLVWSFLVVKHMTGFNQTLWNAWDSRSNTCSAKDGFTFSDCKKRDYDDWRTRTCLLATKFTTCYHLNQEPQMVPAEHKLVSNGTCFWLMLIYKISFYFPADCDYVALETSLRRWTPSTSCQSFVRLVLCDPPVTVYSSER